ncbi:hypothetical protein TrST_g4489 [Triparma strigata]|uniref:Carboxypeptidase n=1 Tax=Triparma strigata TaxID=1606541 RepID=A0A9W7DZX9_9STRA|nr:hypothetical protein TrST_g4489 [Triparma strigata]
MQSTPLLLSSSRAEPEPTASTAQIQKKVKTIGTAAAAGLILLLLFLSSNSRGSGAAGSASAALETGSFKASGELSKPLLLSPLIDKGELLVARELSRTVNGHSGYITTTSTGGKDNHIFFWYQPCTECSDDKSEAPLIQWFNGGPGSPDTVGVFNQIGKSYVDEDLKLQDRCFTICRKASCLFLDSPVGTGYSFQGDPDVDVDEVEFTRTSAETAEQAVDVLAQFLELFPEHKASPYYIQGLSYAGHYVPHMGRAVLDKLKGLDLRGVNVGDPAMDHAREVVEYPNVFKTFGFVDDLEFQALSRMMLESKRLAESGDCVGAFTVWNKVFNDDGGSSCEPHCEFLYETWTGSGNTEHALIDEQPKEFDYFRKWLKVDGHEEEIHVAGSPAAGDSGASLSEGGEMYSTMVESGDFCENTTPIFAELVKSGVDVVISAGNMDVLLGPAMVGEAIKGVVESLGEGALEEFAGSEKQIWRVEGKVVGFAKCIKREGYFCYVVMNNSGHEGFSYQPRASFDLNERLISRKFGWWGGRDEEELPQCKESEGGAGPLLDL